MARQFTNKKKDGSFYVEDAAISPVFNDEGAIINYVGVKRDITKELELETHLRQSQKMEAVGTLAGGIAHDFNNILTPILGYAEMTAQSAPPGSRTEANMKHVIKAATRAKDLVRQILTFSRRDKHERAPLFIHPIVQEALELLRASLPSTIEVRDDIDTACSPVLADSTAIHQVLMNLCTNAAHAMREEGGVLTVSLDMLPADCVQHRQRRLSLGTPYVRLTVKDTGSGMDGDTLEHAFEPFFTTRDVGEGTGLGLSAVHGIVKSHEGEITVKSELGRGTTFSVFLPCTESEPVEEPLPDEPVAGGEERVLLVDDEEVIARMEKETLEGFGYHVTAKTSGRDALDTFRANPSGFDIVVTDFTMPGMTGVQLAEELTRIRPDIPIVLVSGHDQTVSKEEQRNAGISETLEKPILSDDLGRAVRRALDGRQKDG